MTNQLSAVIITFNEERNIAACISALTNCADEILVLDSNSTDRTKEIAESLGAVVHLREWKGYANAKNFLNTLARYPYIFSVDADEVVDQQLIDSLLVEKQKGLNGVYSVNRITNYLGTWIKHSGWYPDIKTRIFPKEGTIWEGDFVHETLKISELYKNQLLKGHLEHYSYHSFADHRSRADKYSILTAQKHAAAGKTASLLKPYLSAVGRFVGMFFLKKGFLDGKMGFHIARISAVSNLLKYRELRRLNREQKN